ncbi:MAG: hypothetical protein IT260_18520 [Saprospiraceae bacterium]|nr:hypothetical protein [Saprospiraceae bacterium]
MKSCIFTFCLAACLALPGLRAQTISWQQLGGPFGGGRPVYEGKPGNLFLIYGDNELYRSTNGGASWQKMPTTPASIWYWPLVVGGDGNLYAGKSNELYRSTNNGQSWTLLTEIDHESIGALPGGEILIGTYNKSIRRSTNNGQTWTDVATGVDATAGFFVHPATGDVYTWADNISTGEQGKVWRSTDQGLSWQVVLEGLNLQPYQIAFSPSGGIFIGAIDKIWRSLDGGANWTSIEPALTDTYRDVHVAVSTTGRLFAFEWYVSKYSDDNGATWHPLQDPLGNNFYLFSTSSAGDLLAVRENSLYRSTDNGATWSFASTGILHSTVIDLQHLDNERLLATTNDGLFYSPDGGANWQLVWNEVNLSNLSIGGLNVEATASGIWYFWNGSDIIRFDNNGQTHTVLNTNFNGTNDFENMWVNPVTNALFVSVWDGLFRSTDGGQTFTKLNNFGASGLSFLPDGSVLTTGANGLLKSTDEGSTWFTLSPINLPNAPLVAPDGNLYILDLYLDTEPVLRVSKDLGLTWARIPLNTNMLVSEALAVNSAGHVFIVDYSQSQVWRSVDGGYSFNFLPQFNGYIDYNNKLSVSSSQRLYINVPSKGIYRSAQATTQVKLLAGSVFEDADANCQAENTDPLLPGWFVRAEQNNETLLGYTNTIGQFVLPVLNGNYDLSVVTPNDYWQSCATQVNIPSSNSIGIVDSVGIGLWVAVECPYAEVSISAPFLRRCFPSTIYVNYKNTGTIPAPGAYIEITLDPFLEFNSASVPVQQNGQTLRIELGDLAVLAQGAFSLLCTPSCTVPLGYEHCVSAHIYPDELCSPAPRPQIRTSANCLGSTIQLRIDNVGDAAMDGPLRWYAIDPLNFVEPFGAVASGTFELAAGAYFTTEIQADYPLIQFYAQQSPLYPFNVISSTVIQNCNPSGTPPLSIVNQDDEGPFEDHFCQENIGAYDPNDKAGLPAGLSDKGYIEYGQRLTYLIRFQNTGTDTAFNVTIRDALPELLDASTLRLEASSHPCRLSMAPYGTLVLGFEHILLPDSNTNEAASHGFARFSIGQQPDNPLGAAIRNRAAIYFDFNEPVLTNYTLHTVGIPRVSGTEPEPATVPRLQLEPNPLRESALLRLGQAASGSGEYVFELFDLSGARLRQQAFRGEQLQVLRGDLSKGFYYFTVKTAAGGLVGSGKVTVH